jgi:hypothetical protein
MKVTEIANLMHSSILYRCMYDNCSNVAIYKVKGFGKKTKVCGACLKKMKKESKNA